MTETERPDQTDLLFPEHVRETLPGAVAEAEAAAALEAGLVAEAEPVPLTQWQLFKRRFKRHKLAIVSMFILFVLFVLCYGVDWFTPDDALGSHLDESYEAPSLDHLFGTTQTGQDYFTAVLKGGQVSLRIGVTVALLSTVIGATLGAIAGYYGRWMDQLLMRVTDLFLIVPALAVLAIARQRFGSDPATISYVLAGLLWMTIARVVRGQTLALKEKEFVEAARAVGASGPRIILRHIIPNSIGPIVVNATLYVAIAIILESTLSFLGFGVDGSWGDLLEEARGNYDNHTHLLYFPGLAILLTVLCVNALGDGLRDALDPHSKH